VGGETGGESEVEGEAVVVLVVKGLFIILLVYIDGAGRVVGRAGEGVTPDLAWMSSDSECMSLLRV